MGGFTGVARGSNGSNQGPGRFLALFMAIFLAAKGGLVLFLAYNSLIVMDEFQQGGMAYYIKYGFYHGVNEPKTVMYAYFYKIAHLIGSSSFHIMLVAREQTALLGFLTLVIVYFISRNIGAGKKEAIFIICVTLSFSTFIERIFRVRSEPLALFFASLALWVVTMEKRTLGKIAWAGLFSVAAFLTTQKSVYFNVALGVALVVNEFATRDKKAAIKTALAFTTGWAAAVVAYGLYFKGLQFYDVIIRVFLSPKYLLTRGGAHFDYLHVFITQTLVRNPVAYVLGVTGWIIAGIGFRKMSEPRRIAWVFSLVAVSLVFNHNQPWPYIFIWAIPFVALWSAEPIMALFKGRSDRRSWVMLLAMVILSGSFARNMRFVEHSNIVQHYTVMQAESLLGVTDKYCDAIGMIVNREQAKRMWWDPPRTRAIRAEAKLGDLGRLDRIFAREPKVWVITFRTEVLKDILRPYFLNSFVRIFSNVLVTGAKISSDAETLFNNYWPGKYRLYSPHGARMEIPFYIDGVKVSGVVNIGKGDRSIRLDGNNQTAYLLPADIPTQFQIPPRRRPIALFPWVFTY